MRTSASPTLCKERKGWGTRSFVAGRVVRNPASPTLCKDRFFTKPVKLRNVQLTAAGLISGLTVSVNASDAVCPEDPTVMVAA